MTIKAVEAGHPVDVDALGQVGMLVNDQDMPDEVRAKLHKALGYVHSSRIDSTPEDRRQSQRETALVHLRRALELHDKVGVKKDIERLEREIKNAAPAGAKEGDGRG